MKDNYFHHALCIYLEKGKREKEKKGGEEKIEVSMSEKLLGDYISRWI